MSILRKKGKEKLLFKIMNTQVSNSVFKNLKMLILKCLNENPDITKRLDKSYKLIQIYFFYDAKDPNVESILQRTLNDSNVTFVPKPNPALAQSRKNIGCILVFIKHLEEFTKKRKDIEDVEEYQKNGLFEELCHLVEHKGDSSICPKSYWKLWAFYRKRNLLGYGNEIIARLDTDRNHYEVYLMMLKAYPDMWIERYSNYYLLTTDQFRKQYEQQKRNTPIEIVYARLVTDFLRSLNVFYVAEKARKESISEKNRKILEALIETGKRDIQGKRDLIEKDMGEVALTLADSMDEKVFQTPEIFFGVILDLWKNLKLI